ncbi:MAG TPA: TetR/AcrR family transcriptional regulator [Polyangiaceae bacterium]|nr:TetR/AcrR family transcriptional regulator [Polyangiaceae bacterium]
MAPAERRDVILRAALALFVERGFGPATMAEVCARAGVSNGSLFHHFPSKEALGAAVYLEGLGRYQARLLGALRAEADAERGVRAAVGAHLAWVGENPDWAQFLFAMGRAEVAAAAPGELGALNRPFFAAVEAWFAGHVAAGRVRAMPREVRAAVLVGPAQEFCRGWLRRRDPAALERARPLLEGAAWRGVKAKKRKA